MPSGTKRKERSLNLPEEEENNRKKEETRKRVRTGSPDMLDLSHGNELKQETAGVPLQSPLTDILNNLGLDSSDSLEDKEAICHLEEPCEDLELQLSDTEDEGAASGD